MHISKKKAQAIACSQFTVDFGQRMVYTYKIGEWVLRRSNTVSACKWHFIEPERTEERLE